MNAEKHVTPILLIVVVLVALVCTYAWFTAGDAIVANIEMSSGVATAFSLTGGEIGQETIYTASDLYSGEGRSLYSGQKGYKVINASTSQVYTDNDKPFYVFKTLSYKMSGQADVVVDVALEKFFVKVHTMYTDTFKDTLKNIMGLTEEQATAVMADNSLKANYYVEYTSQMESVSKITAPTGANPSPIYMVYNSTTSKVIYLVFTGNQMSNFMTFDYWVSDGTSNGNLGLIPNDNPANNPASKKATGIRLHFLESGSTPGEGYDGVVTKTGFVNYLGVYVGFYGHDGTKYTECAFSNQKYRGSTFSFMFSAGGM